MKIRNGFVSNSSSSSFIVGYGVVRQGAEHELRDFLKEQGLAVYEYGIATLRKYKAARFQRGMDLGFIDFPIKVDEIDDNDLICVIEIANNEGDGTEFYAYPNYEPNYEQAKNIDFYSEKQQEIIKMLSDGRFFDKNKPYEHLIGAARNG